MININYSSFGQVGVGEVAGQLDQSGTAALAQVMEDALAAGARSLVLDLSGLTALDIAGLRGLNSALKRTRRAGGDLRLAAPSDPALESLQASRLDEIFKIYETAQAAIASF